MSVKALAKLVVLASLLGGAYYFVRHTQAGQSLTIDRLTQLVNATHPVVARLAYVLGYIVGTVLLFPGILLSFVGATLFGYVEGTLWTWIGAVVGATLAFFVAKGLGRDFVDRLLAGRFKALDDRLREHGFTGLLVIRLLPIFPFNGVNFGSGLTSIGTRDYVLATAIGILPGTFVYQYLFATLGRKALDEGFSWSDLAQPDVLGAVGVFIVFLLATKWIVGRFQRQNDQAQVKSGHEPQV